MKKQINIGTICWIGGAIIWAVMAWIYLSEGKVGFALIQTVLAVWFAVSARISCSKNRKK